MQGTRYSADDLIVMVGTNHPMSKVHEVYLRCIGDPYTDEKFQNIVRQRAVAPAPERRPAFNLRFVLSWL